MNLYVGALLVWTMGFANLASRVDTFVYIGTLGSLITRSKNLYAALDARIVIGYASFIVLGLVLILINVIPFGDHHTRSYWIAGFKAF